MRRRKTKLLLASIGAVVLFLVSMTVSTNAATLPASSSMDAAGLNSPSTYTLSQLEPEPEIPEGGTTVYFMVRVHSELGVFESQIGYYTVRSGEIESLITIIALGLGGVVLLVMGRSLKRRRK